MFLMILSGLFFYSQAFMIIENVLYDSFRLLESFFYMYRLLITNGHKIISYLQTITSELFGRLLAE